jgi:hypothetical protein
MLLPNINEPGYWLSDAVDVYWGCGDEGDDEAGCCGQRVGIINTPNQPT